LNTMSHSKERLGQLISSFIKPLSVILAASELDVCFPMIAALDELHSNAISGKRENVGKELCALAGPAEAVYASHIVALDVREEREERMRDENERRMREE
jgi:hypothetical protein